MEGSTSEENESKGDKNVDSQISVKENEVEETELTSSREREDQSPDGKQ